MVVGWSHVVGRRNSMCKGPVVGMRLGCSKKNMQGERGGVRVNKEGRGVKSG